MDKELLERETVEMLREMAHHHTDDFVRIEAARAILEYCWNNDDDDDDDWKGA